jgi:hypothetical protein
LTYRLTRYFSFGVVYGFRHFDFTRAFGSSDVHFAELSIAARLSRRWELAATTGAARVESLFFGAVAIDPAIAAITGQSVAIRALYNIRYVPTGQLRLARVGQHTNLEARYSREISSGNGVYLTSQQEDASVTFGYTGVRHWYLSTTGQYSHLSAVAQVIGAYDGYQLGGGVTRDLASHMQVIFRADDRRYFTHFAGFSRNAVRVTLGLSWSPGNVPLALW